MSVRENIFYNFLLSSLNFIFPLFSAPYISRVLGVENIGLVNFAMSYVGYFAVIAVLGVDYYGVREIAKYKDDQKKTSKVFSELFLINCVTTIVVTIIYFLSIWHIPSLQQNWKIFVLVGVNLYLIPISLDWYFRGLEYFKIITNRSIVIKFLSFVGLFIFVKQREDVIPYILLYVCSVIGTYILNFIYAKKTGLKIKWTNINVKVHIKPMLIFFVSHVAISIFTMLDVLMLGFLSSYKQVGFFTSPNRILGIIMSFFAAINTALIPRLAFNQQQQSNDNANKELLQKAFDFSSLLIIPAAIGLCLLSARFIPFFLGPEFLGSILPMQILSFKIIVVMINSFFGFNILMTFGYENKYAIVLFTCALFSFVLNLIFIPKYGAGGAAATTIAAESLEVLLNLFLVYKFTKIRINWMSVVLAMICTLPFFVLYFLCNILIQNSVLFLLIFIGLSILVYVILQLFIVKNYLLIQIGNRMQKLCMK
jgi:O-antigen/teichoic acid export membrane protein